MIQCIRKETNGEPYYSVVRLVGGKLPEDPDQVGAIVDVGGKAIFAPNCVTSLDADELRDIAQMCERGLS